MSATAESPFGPVPTERPKQGGWLAAVESLLVRLGDWLNPIMVKESRQSLKSRQFVVTFHLVLVAALAVLYLGLAFMGSEVSYTARGADLFLFCLWVLAFPLLVIVPFTAFRSLASEQEDRTYELMSITALSPRQIISGKLWSAAAQTVLYLSAITPFLALTYMLRGIAFTTIFFLVFYIALGSLALAAIGLLVGTLTSEKHWQVVLSVIMIIGLLIAFWIGCGMASVAIWEADMPVDTAEFWWANAAMLTAYLTYFALVFHAAVARITFASDNRSSRLRAIMLLQHICLTGWMFGFLIAEEGHGELIVIFLTLAGLHWYVMGSMMTGESPDLSPRVKRRLPQSFLGRVFLTWFNPGPATGFMFAVSGGLAALVLTLIAIVLRELLGLGIATGGWSSDDSERLFTFSVLMVGYLTIYLGVGLLLIRLMYKLGQVGIFLSLLIQILLVMAGCAIPMVIETMSPGFGYMEYSLIHISNPFWTLIHVGGDNTVPVEAAVLLIVVPLTAVVVFLMNLPGVIKEVRHVRVAKPSRVAEEDAELEALITPPEPTRISPWDE